MAEIFEADSEEKTKLKIFEILDQYESSLDFPHLSDNIKSVKGAIENTIMGGIALGGGGLAVYKLFQNKDQFEGLMALISYGVPVLVALTLFIHYRKEILAKISSIVCIIDSVREPNKEKVIASLVPAIESLRQYCDKDSFRPICKLIKEKIMKVNPEILPDIRHIMRELDKKN